MSVARSRSPIPGPLVLNIEVLRHEAERAVRRQFRNGPPLVATDVHVTADDQVQVLLCAHDGRARWGMLLGPDADLAHFSILRFEFTELLEEAKGRKGR